MSTTQPQNVNVVRRTDIRSISSVEANNEIHNLGEHRDFRRHDALRYFMPEQGRYSFSWVSLKDGEKLDNHIHPTASMIIICEGSVEVTGEVEKTVCAGDIVCVPPGRIHGFRTGPGQMFNGLSVQFEGEGLYENEVTPRVAFQEHSDSPFKQLESLNNQLLARHQENSLFTLFNSKVLETDVAKKNKFLSALSVWSHYFQKMLYARQAFCTDDELLPLYRQHLDEEYGHDTLLKNQYQIDDAVYDPLLESTSQWFINKMLSSDEAEKIVIVHMVVESSGHVFGEATKHIFNKASASHSEDTYFDVHAEADDDHSQIGLAYIHKASPAQFPKLMETCRQAWDQMDLVHERIALLTQA